MLGFEIGSVYSSVLHASSSVAAICCTMLQRMGSPRALKISVALAASAEGGVTRCSSLGPARLPRLALDIHRTINIRLRSDSPEVGRTPVPLRLDAFVQVLGRHRDRLGQR